MCVWAQVHMEARCHSLPLPLTALRQNQALNHKEAALASLATWCLPSMVWRQVHDPLLSFMWVLGSKLRPSCLHSSLTNWATPSLHNISCPFPSCSGLSCYFFISFISFLTTTSVCSPDLIQLACYLASISAFSYNLSLWQHLYFFSILYSAPSFHPNLCFFKDSFLYMNVYANAYLCLTICTCKCAGSYRSLGVGVTGSCMLLDIIDGIWTQVLMIEQKKLITAELSFQFLQVYFLCPTS